MKQHARYFETYLTSTTPAGWLQRWLELQKHGLTGHLEVAGYPFNTRMWAGPALPMTHGEPWWPYEQTAYWIDGLIRCGYLLGDDALLKKSKQQIDHVLKHASKDGYLGPKSCKRPMHAGRWSHMIFFRAMIAHYHATGDERIVPALEKHYLSDTAPHNGHRDVCNVEIMCWVYGMTGNKAVLGRALKAYKEYLDSPADQNLKPAALARNAPATEHGVTFCETIKVGALLYMCTGDAQYLKASMDGFKKLDRFHMLIDGIPSSTENLRGKTDLDAHETCDIADYTWSAGYMFMATGKTAFLDKIERACFNAAPGAIRYDFKGLQYFSCPNQTIAANNTSHALMASGSHWMSYRPRPGTECCTAQVNRIIPNYAARMWMRGADGAVTPALYGPSVCQTEVGSGKVGVQIKEETTYPFSERIDFLVCPSKTVEFTLRLRIPGWCAKGRVLINGKPTRFRCKPGTFVDVRRTFERNDRVTLELPMDLKLVRCKNGGIAIERGPILFALKIRERWEVDGDDENSTREFPAYNCYPESAWNYALDLDEQTLLKSVEVVHRPITAEPFFPDQAPIELRVPAYRVNGWRLRYLKRLEEEAAEFVEDDNGGGRWRAFTKVNRGDFVVTPPLPSPGTLAKRLGRKRETVTLVPYGCTHLRITTFPQVPRKFG